MTHLFEKYGHVTLKDLLDIKLRVREDVYKYEVTIYYLGIAIYAHPNQTFLF